MSKRAFLYDPHKPYDVRTLGCQLVSMGYELIVADPHTAEALARDNVPYRDVEALTWVRHVLHDAVDVLHPSIFAGVLSHEDRPDEMAELSTRQWEHIALVAVNLAPFLEVACSPICLKQLEERLNIQMLEVLFAAAFNPRFVVTLCDACDYPKVITQLRTYSVVDQVTKLELAAKAHERLREVSLAVGERYLREAARYPARDPVLLSLSEES